MPRRHVANRLVGEEAKTGLLGVGNQLGDLRTVGLANVVILGLNQLANLLVINLRLEDEFEQAEAQRVSGLGLHSLPIMTGLRQLAAHLDFNGLVVGADQNLNARVALNLLGDAQQNGAGLAATGA